jgi:hypothetical protein
VLRCRPGAHRQRGDRVLSLSALIALLAAIVCSAGLFWDARGGRDAATSVRGEEVELWGEGLYRFDSVFVAAGSRGTDVITLFLEDLSYEQMAAVLGVTENNIGVMLHRAKKKLSTLMKKEAPCR